MFLEFHLGFFAERGGELIRRENALLSAVHRVHANKIDGCLNN